MDRPEPAGSAKLPKVPHRSPTSPTPATVAAVIAAAKDQQLDLLAVYVWLAAVTGARRGELCGLQWADVDLDAGLVHIAFSYLVRAGQKMRKDTRTHQERTLAPPCGATSQWVNRIIRTITTRRGTLVLHEAGLQCPLPRVGPQVRAVWVADSPGSTGIFYGARGQGSDIPYPALNTAAPQGTLTLAL